MNILGFLGPPHWLRAYIVSPTDCDLTWLSTIQPVTCFPLHAGGWGEKKWEKKQLMSWDKDSLIRKQEKERETIKNQQQQKE